MKPSRHLWTFFVGCALLASSGPARAQSQGQNPLVTGTFGNWSISATEDLGLQIANRHSPEAVRLKFTHGSNGWFWLQTTVGQYVMWSAGNFSQQNFSFDEAKPDPNAPALRPGVYTFGSWMIRVTADELFIDHPDNPHQVVLPSQSRGAIDIRGIQMQGDRTVNPGDALAVDGP